MGSKRRTLDRETPNEETPNEETPNEETPPQPELFRFTVDDACAMGETDIFRDARVELIGGQFIVKEPSASSHAGTIYLLQQRLSRALGESAIVAAQGPLVLSEVDAPEPDVMVLAPRDDFYISEHPTANDVYLVMEVANTSLRYDQSTKAALYAAARIRMYGIVDVNEAVIHVHTDPGASEYADVQTLRRGDTLTLPASLPAKEPVRIPVADMFPTAADSASATSSS